ncbi:MAG: Lrp/AsnC ligand binding domain-containing protein [Candidatus Nanopelagicales bacterium]
MTVQAYILVQTQVGTASEVTQHIRGLVGVTVAEDVTGPYDVIVRAEAESMDQFGQGLLTDIQALSGVTRTLTCPIVSL